MDGHTHVPTHSMRGWSIFLKDGTCLAAVACMHLVLLLLKLSFKLTKHVMSFDTAEHLCMLVQVIKSRAVLRGKADAAAKDFASLHAEAMSELSRLKVYATALCM